MNDQRRPTTQQQHQLPGKQGEEDTTDPDHLLTPPHMNLAADSSPEMSPRSPPSSPRMVASPSPLLLSVTESPTPKYNISPVASRGRATDTDHPGAYSDSDVGSSVTNNNNLTRGRKDKKIRTTKSSSSKERNGSKTRRRRKSNDSEIGSIRSTSIGGRENKNNQTSRILRNLLILEESLRQQLRDQKDLRRQYTAFVAILSGLFAFALYSLFIDNEYEPSPLWKLSLRFLLFFIVVTFSLFYLGGDYHRTIVLPRRFFSSTNKGLRQLNLKLVKVNTSYSDLFIDYSRTFLSIVVRLSSYMITHSGPFKQSMLAKWITQKLKTLELSSQPRVGATDVKLILNPRSFPSEIREAWESYRDEFWSREGHKRRQGTNVETSTAELKSLKSLKLDDKVNRRMRKAEKVNK